MPAPTATRTMRFHVGREGSARLIFDSVPRELELLCALSVSQGHALVVQSELAPYREALVGSPVLLLPHLNVLGVRQWAPRSPVQWPLGWVLRMKLERLVPGPLYLCAHFEPVRSLQNGTSAEAE